MPEIFVYLLKINIAFSLFYLGYYLFMRKLTFYSLNRFYLLLSILLSVIFPFLSIPPMFSKPEIISYNFLAVEGTIENLPQTVETQSIVWLVLTAVYWAIVFFGGLKLLTRLVSLYRIHLKSSAKQWEGYKFNTLSLETDPFSFMNKIYLNFDNHTEQERHTILKHELVHTRNFHSLDILLIEIWSIFSWFNPISKLMRKSIKVNIEFIADHEVIKQGISNIGYQNSLLHFAIEARAIPLVNQFSFVSLKSRIMMMNKKRSSKRLLGVYFIILPIIVSSLFFFGVSKAYQVSESLDVFISEQPVQDENTIDQDSVMSKRTKVHVQFRAATDSSASPLDKALYVIDGIPQESKLGNWKLDISPEDIESISVLKGQDAVATYGKEGEDGVILITTKENGKGISGERKIILKRDRIVSKVEVEEGQKNGNPFSVLGIDASLRNGKSVKGFDIRSSSKNGPLFIIDGKEVDEEVMKRINPDQIELVTVFKDNESIKSYGEKGENGVILIELKKNSPEQ